MKKYTSFLLFLILGLTFAQEKKDILPLAEDLVQKTLSGEYETVLDYTYPKIFDIVSREQMMQLFQSMLKNDQFEIMFNEIDNDLQLGDEKRIHDGKYVMVEYNNSLSIKFHEMEGMDPDFMLNMFKNAYPDGEVSYDKTEQKFDIETISKMLAISDEYTQGEWRFLNVNDSDRTMMQMILSEDIIKAFEL